ncbi:MAG: anthranilate phosphoribosyltransferase [Gammaproteobacteria bacterium]|nr:anthranilate phosphoribosyltransferase [Gammaproteobacteria bacterium]
MNIQQAIRNLTEHQNLSRQEMTDIMQLIMTGQATPAQIGGFLIGLRMKGETVDEIAAGAMVMRRLSTKVEISGPHVVDIVGTGGDSSGTFNISTACTFVVAAAGGKVAKHGNRSVSSRSGSADVLEAAGVRLDITPEQVTRCINEVGVGFMFAPLHHSAMKHAIGPRKEMAVRTLFNLLGPLTNPAGAPNQLLGVFSGDWVEPLAEVLATLGSNHVLVVHSQDGLDEISIGAPTTVAELKDGSISSYTLTPEQFGLERTDIREVTVDSAEESLKMVREVLDGTPGPARDIVALNAGAAIYAADLCDNLEQGIETASLVIKDGSARQKLDDLIRLTSGFQSS